MQSLRLVACMSAQRDNSAFPFGGSESSSTAPAGGDAESKNQNADCRLRASRTADNFRIGGTWRTLPSDDH
eukprot:737001-Prymnesium_polylepis.1